MKKIDFRYFRAPEVYEPRPGDAPSVFLAGGIPDVMPWRERALAVLADAQRPLIVIDPERTNFPVGDYAAGRAQVHWEFRHLHLATVTMVWFPETMPGARRPVVQPSTLWELSAAVAEPRPFVVGAHPAYERRDIVEHQLSLYPHVVVHDTLEATLDATLQLVDDLDGVAVADARTKLTGLSVLQTRALHELLTDDEKTQVTYGATYAEFAMTRTEAHRLVATAQARATDHYRHPYKSLHAVLRRLEGGGDRG